METPATPVTITTEQSSFEEAVNPVRIETIFGTFLSNSGQPVWVPKRMQDSLVFDSATGRLWYYVGGAWKSTEVTGLTANEIAAITGAASPSALNVFATMADLPAKGGNFAHLDSELLIDAATVGTTETTILSGTVHANNMGVNGVLRVRVAFQYYCANSAANVLTINLKLGSQVIASVGVTQGDTTGRTYYGAIEGFIMNANSASAQRGFVKIETPVTNSKQLLNMNYGTGTVNTGADQTFSLSLVFYNTGSGTFYGESGFLELVPAITV